MVARAQLAGGPIDWVPLSPDGFEIGRYHDDNEEYNFSGVIDDVRVFSRALSPSEIAAWYGFDTPDMSEVNLSVTEDSALRVRAPGVTPFGTLTLQQGILAVEGTSDGVRFDGTTVPRQPTGTVGVDLQVPVDLGALTGNDASATFVKTGPQDLVLDGEGSSGLDDFTFEVQQGTLIGLHGGNPFGGGDLTLAGGNLTLAAKPAAGENVLYNNQLTLSEDGTLTAGSGGASGAATGPVTVTLGSDTKGVLLGSHTLRLQSAGDYRLDVAGPASGSGELHVAGGDVILSGGGNAGSLRVSGGTLSLTADIEVQTMSVANGVVDTGDSQVIVGSWAGLANTPLQLDSGSPFLLSGSDLGNDQVDRLVTLSGGTFQLGASSVPLMGLVSYWSLDEGPGSESAADFVGGNDGTLVNLDAGTAWVAGHSGANDDYALRFDGTPDEYVSAGTDPSLQVAADLSISAWINVAAFSDWPSVAGWIHDSGSVEAGYALGLIGGGSLYWGVGPEASGVINYQYADGLQTDTWYHLVATYDADTGLQSLYVDAEVVAQTQLVGGPIDWEPLSPDGFEIGRYHDNNEEYNFSGVIDDVLVYERALDDDEVAALYSFTPEDQTIDLPRTNLRVTADTTLNLSAPGQSVLGNLALEEGVTLKVPAAAPSFNDLSADGGAKIEGSIQVRGTLAGDLAAAELTIEGKLRLGPDAVFAATVGATANDKIVAETDQASVVLGNSSLEFQIDGSDPFTAGTYTLIEVDPSSEDRISGKFGFVDGLGQYVSKVPDGDGIVKTDTTLTVTTDRDLNLGDANLDTITDVRDFNVWNAHKFTDNTEWASGDFNGDGLTDVRDFNQWNAHKFTTAEEPEPLVGQQVPEPATLVLLAVGALALATYARRRPT